MADPQAVRAAWRGLGRQLAAKRKAAKLSQQVLADQTRYSRSSIANIETGFQQINRTFRERSTTCSLPAVKLVRGYDAAEALRRPGTATSGDEVRIVPASTMETPPASRFSVQRPRIQPEEDYGAALAARHGRPDLDAALPGEAAQSRRTYNGTDAEGALRDSGLDVDIVDVLARIQNLFRAVDPAVISGLERDLSSMFVEYGTWDRGRFTRSLVKKRLFVDVLIDGASLVLLERGQRSYKWRLVEKVPFAPTH